MITGNSRKSSAERMKAPSSSALEALRGGPDNKEKYYFQAQVLKAMGRFDKSMEAFERAGEKGWDAVEINTETIELLALSGKTQQARSAFDRMDAGFKESADGAYLHGLLSEMDGNADQALNSYEKARSLRPAHPQATFRLAYYCDLHGDDERALELYRESVSKTPVFTSALLNLSVLYEDIGRSDQAIACLQRVLAVNPNHPRARLFLKDAQASMTMFFDEEQAKWIARRNAVLDIPVTDFELSVRARNCLKKMNIRTLGDLARISEPELLDYKNFGETSLKEIKDMLASKGLRLGQALEENNELIMTPPVRAESPAGTPDIPIEQVEMSIRVRRALEVLNIQTLGQLAAKTEKELLACKNFGQTSLNEVRQRLAEYGLASRED